VTLRGGDGGGGVKAGRGAWCSVLGWVEARKRKRGRKHIAVAMLGTHDGDCPSGRLEGSGYGGVCWGYIWKNGALRLMGGGT
jgi:hypothetical protein